MKTPTRRYKNTPDDTEIFPKYKYKAKPIEKKPEITLEYLEK